LFSWLSVELVFCLVGWMGLVVWLVSVLVGVQLNGLLKYVTEIISCYRGRRQRNMKGNSYELLAAQE